MDYSHIFTAALLCTGALVAFKTLRNRTNSTAAVKSSSFHSFERRYLFVYYLMMAGDWLQGPYVYALYDGYGYSREDIALLFVAGFGSSMVFGTFIGSLADRYGRKRFALLYVVLYIASCLTKHFNNFSMLMLGRLLGGISTSLLFSVFESWLVCENNTQGFDKSWISDTFSTATLGNSIVAIVCGVVAEYATEFFPRATGIFNSTVGGYTAPFDLAILALAVGGMLLATTWSENYGSRVGHIGVFESRSFFQALDTVKSNRIVLFCGLSQSFFEGAMYSFVFMWTPAVMESSPEGTSPPFGTIFATFMLACMFGSQCFGFLMQRFSVEKVLMIIFFVGAISLATVPIDYATGSNLSYMGFILFEICVGVYFPAMGTLKSQVVPDNVRSTVYNIFRIPLNAIVLIVLLGHFSVATTFQMCVVLLVGAFLLTSQVSSLRIKESEDVDIDSETENLMDEP